MECNGVGKRWVCLLGSVDEDQLPDRIRDTEGSKGLQEKGKEGEGDKSESEMSVLIDEDEPPKKKKGREAGKKGKGEGDSVRIYSYPISLPITNFERTV